MRLSWSKVKEEVLALLPPTLFFFIALHFFALIRALMTRGTGLAAASSVQITIAALIIGKAVVLADLWPPINRFPDRPLIYNIAWKTIIYFAVASLIHYLERLYDFAKAAGGVAAGNARLLAEIVWPHFFGMQLILLLIIFNYCVIRELGLVMGEGRMLNLFFGIKGREPSPAEAENAAKRDA